MRYACMMLYFVGCYIHIGCDQTCQLSGGAGSGDDETLNMKGYGPTSIIVDQL